MNESKKMVVGGMVENVSLSDAMFCIRLEKRFFVVKNNIKSRCHSSTA